MNSVWKRQNSNHNMNFNETVCVCHVGFYIQFFLNIKQTSDLDYEGPLQKKIIKKYNKDQKP